MIINLIKTIILKINYYISINEKIKKLIIYIIVKFIERIILIINTTSINH